MLDDVKKIILSEQDIKNKVTELANQINEDYKGKNPFFIVILKGASIFACDLFKQIKLSAQIDFMVVSSYGSGTETSGQVKITKDVSSSITGKDVIIIEDIVDTGITLNCLVKVLSERNPNSIEICSCVSKPSRRLVPVNVKYIGFDVENEFIIGYGLDYNEKYRNLPFIGVLKEEVYQGER